MSGTTWTKFFWSDWQTDPGLRRSSYAARGLWMEMLCIAAGHDPIGYVAVAGMPLTGSDLARMTGGSESEVASLLLELERNGVFSRDRRRFIYSRRMVSDAKRSATFKKNGQKGGNPSLSKERGISGLDKPPDKPPDKTHKPEAIVQIPEKENLAAVADLPREEGQTLLLQICSRLGVDLRADPSRINWPVQLNAMIREGLNPEHLLASASSVPKEKAKALKGLSYLAPKARELQAAAALPAPLQVFENTDIRGWTDRARVWFGISDEFDLKPIGAWVRKWGPKPGEDGCHCPEEIISAVGAQVARSVSGSE